MEGRRRKEDEEEKDKKRNDERLKFVEKEFAMNVRVNERLTISALFLDFP